MNTPINNLDCVYQEVIEMEGIASMDYRIKEWGFGISPGIIVLVVIALILYIL